MSLSETAFLERCGDTFKLRWFTPKIEVDLCGHATLASAHFLFDTGQVAEEEVLFDFLLRLEDEAAVHAAAPDFRALAQVATRGAVVTAEADHGAVDFVSRFFAPSVGIDEDPMTGSAHCLLGPYWGGALGKRRLLAHQASTRGGEVGVELREDGVVLLGRAVTVWRGTLSPESTGP